MAVNLPGRFRQADRVLLPAATLVVAVVVVGWGRLGPDWPAQEFRAWTAARYGLTAWTNLWYSGQALPGYSLVFPVVAGAVGAAWTGLLAAFAASIAANRLAPDASRRVVIAYYLSVTLVLGCDLVIGQIPYLMGVAFGAWAVWAARESRPWLAALLALGAAAASPLAGAFVLLSIPALACSLGWRRVAPLAAAMVGVVASSMLGGASGPFPFVWTGLVCVLAFGVLAIVLTKRDRGVQVLAVCYVLGAVLLAVVPNPVGGNLVRFGQLVALPVLWHVLPRLRVRSRLVAVPLVALCALWPAWPAVSSIGRGASDPSRQASFYTGLLGFLSHQNPTKGRLEVVMTREHWEALWVAQAFPIARGWERQTDLAVNAVLYSPLTPAAYHRWLTDNSVSLVALPNAPIDYGGRAEAALLRHPPAYLKPVWHDRNWQVWRVRGARSMVTGPATMHHFGPASFVLSFRRAGSAVVRIRSSGMWSVTSGEGCVTSTSQGWLRVRVDWATSVTLRASVGLNQLAASPHCS